MERETRRAILDALAAGPATGPELAARLDVSRAAVWKHVEALRDAGFTVESGPDGYGVTGVPEYGALAVEFGLDAPFAVEYHDAVASTNDRARDLAADGATDVVVLADEQTGGRGRRGRDWASPPGGVWLSLLVRPAVAPARAPLLTLGAAVAVTAAAREAGADARIKWPNDVLLDREGEPKVAGVLTEMEGEADRVSWVALGAGVNANVDAGALPAGATSLADAVGEIDRRRFVQRLVGTFEDIREDREAIRERWRSHALTLGRRVRVETTAGTVTGEAVDVAATGALVVDTGSGRETVHAGDCEHLHPA
jgi:BirA family biotin operon repressor/biotin-[acetyl-CoA-carboxylase] ligase